MERDEFSSGDAAFHGPQETITVVEEEAQSGLEDDDHQSSESVHNQLVVFDPAVNGAGQIEVIAENNYRNISFPGRTSRILPSVGAFAVQCADCFKWRFIPTKEKYEEIREHILEDPFVCRTASEWRAGVCCDDAPDIEQDGSRLWAIDKPNIAQPPPGWQRLLRIRGEGSTKFADVYYVAPSGKRFRSMVEVQKFLEEHPEYTEQGVRMSQFSFQIPKPLKENYVRKRAIHPQTPQDESDIVKQIEWRAPEEKMDLQLGQSGISGSTLGSRFPDSEHQRSKSKKMKTPPKKMCNFDPAVVQRLFESKDPSH